MLTSLGIKPCVASFLILPVLSNHHACFVLSPRVDCPVLPLVIHPNAAFFLKPLTLAPLASFSSELYFILSLQPSSVFSVLFCHWLVSVFYFVY
jgi:hypothetical protein